MTRPKTRQKSGSSVIEVVELGDVWWAWDVRRRRGRGTVEREGMDQMGSLPELMKKRRGGYKPRSRWSMHSFKEQEREEEGRRQKNQPNSTNKPTKAL